MRNSLRRTANYGDPKVNELAQDLQRTFDSQYDSSILKITMVWKTPFSLSVPYYGGIPRLNSPDIVRCERARNLSDTSVLICPGSASWEWLGQNQVRIDAVAGLTEGTKYELTFEVVS